MMIAPYAPSIIPFRGELIRDLLREGCAVDVLAPDYCPEIRAALRALGAIPHDYPLQRAGVNPWRDLQTLTVLCRQIRRMQPDIVLCYHIKPVVYGTLAAWFARVPRRVALITGLGYAFADGRCRSVRDFVIQQLVRLLYRAALRVSHVVCFQNPDDLSELVARRFVSAHKAVLVGSSGVNLDEWAPAPPHLNPITFTLAARLLREKGIPEFAHAARQLKARYPHTRFLLLGGLDTNPSALTEAEVQQWVREGLLEWLGHVSDVRPYLAQTSVYVLPSYYREGVPRSTQEAMAMARPVITTDAPGCRETVVDGVNGFLVPPRNVEALVEAMERFILQPELIIRMGEASRKLAEERFDVRKINQKLLQVLGVLPAP